VPRSKKPDKPAAEGPQKVKEKLAEKQFKVEKLEKFEKFEKLEHKDKLEKFEKPEHKEKFEKFEKIEHKDKVEKFEKNEKDEIEFIPQPVQIPDPAPRQGTIEERVARLEQLLSQLSHFIGAELRPDLSRGALKQEAAPGAKPSGRGGAKEPG
jgi:hypothetical protein